MTQTPACRNLVPFHFAFGVRISGGLLTYNRLKKISNLRTGLKSSQPLEWSQLMRNESNRLQAWRGAERMSREMQLLMRDSLKDQTNYQPMEIRIVPKAAWIVLVTL